MQIEIFDEKVSVFKKDEINTSRFEGWKIVCPHCNKKTYISDEDTNINFNEAEDKDIIIRCEHCNKEIEIIV